MSWTWKYLQQDGSNADPTEAVPAAATEFPAQSDAETWLGESWRELGAAGVNAVVLYEDERIVYGPMSLENPA